MPRTLPHWPYATALDQALIGRGVPPGIVRLNLGARPDELMRIRLGWDVSRCVGPGGIRLLWDEETGWAYACVGPGYSIPRGPVTSLRRVYATPEAVAAAADSLVHTGRPPAEVCEEEWPQAGEVRDAIDAIAMDAG
ncbi:DUF6292 family protein [Streptomyces sp. WAC00263]|uniref:DUF6292 family protein n=1 Tax=Streptomyces sp. WAC00263 TaxID=1917422 RepID=UPI0015EEF052|nr:DUF6292 family protein [Streptomyces sp. WAC00263]